MSNYGVFAQYYDRLTDNVDYEVRSSYISDFFKTSGITSGTLLDLACGTCTMSIPFVKNGFRLIGIDSSEDMLSEASKKLLSFTNNFSLVKGDMCDFELSDSVDGVICTLDSVNHITDINKVKYLFENVYKYLKKDGVFVFDVNTIYKHQEILGDNTFVFDEDDFFLTWDNELIDESTVRIILDFFIFNGESYDRFNEEFCEKAYELDELRQLLENEGFKSIDVYDELTHNSPSEQSERVYFVCKR